MVICGMSIMRITIVNPKAEKLLKDLEELNLIAIEDTSINIVTNALKKFFSKEDTTPASTPMPSLEEIIKEVDIVRRERYEKKRVSSQELRRAKAGSLKQAMAAGEAL